MENLTVLWVAMAWAPWPILLALASLLLSGALDVHVSRGGASSGKMRAVNAFLQTNYWKATATDDGAPEGIIIGKWFVAWVSVDSTGIKHVCIAKPLWLARAPGAKERVRGKTIDMWNRTGNSQLGMNYSKTVLDVPSTPTGEQQAAVDGLIDLAARSEANGYGFNAVALICGPTGCGKTQVGLLIAKKLGGGVCFDHNPMDAGDSFMSVVLRANPSRSKPLVIMYNEWNTTVASAFKRPGEFRYDNVAPEVWNKTSYNNYMDKLARTPNVLCIFTSNSSAADIRKIDPSAIRIGRIDLEIEMHDVAEVRRKYAARFD